ncbi:MAG TPA: alpha-amylase family glycosyl hydrolase [Gaiellaceae bacterium]|nr:alpha-amylase family glycosyl hydrolase [Gaiellaceae bacterium]
MRRCASALVAALALAVPGATAGTGPAPPPAGTVGALAAAPPPSSLASERIYFVMTDRYANGDPSNDTGGYGPLRSQNGFDPASPAYWHGGDFEGLTGGCTDPVHGLERIRNLGFTAIWVTPPVVNQVSQGDSAGYHGHWGLDFTRVDPHLGTNADFAAFVDCAHRLGLKVIMDVVVNHTGDVIQLAGGTGYSDLPYRDCRGKVFDPARYAGTGRFPCLNAASMPRRPFVLPGLANAKQPAWLNDPLNYHDRGDVDFGSCSEQCFEQGDVYGLDDLFTEKPVVERGQAAIYAGWIRTYKLDGFRVDTARHLDARFFRQWVPQVTAAARAAGVPDFQIFGEVFDANALDLVPFVRSRGLPTVLDFPFQDAVAGYAAGGSSALAVRNRLDDDDYFRLPDGRDPAPPTFLGNHDLGRAALQISRHGAGLSGEALLRRVLLGYDLLYLLRGAPVVYYGDEIGMIGTGGDQQARQDMFPTQVAEWRSQPRVGGSPIGERSPLEITDEPIEARLRELAALRDAYPELATGWTVVRRAAGKVLVVSRIDPGRRRELVVAFNAGDAAAEVTIPTAASGPWQPVFGATATVAASGSRRLAVSIPATAAAVYVSTTPIAAIRAPAPAVSVGPDDLSSYVRLSARVATGAPVSVAFAVQRPGGRWQRVAIDDSPPYRAFLEAGRLAGGRTLRVVAIARALDGSTAVSKVVTAGADRK